MMKRLSFRYRVIILNSIAIALVIITGIYAYEKFTGIITQMSKESGHNNRLLKVKSILNNMSESESYVKSFGITKDTTYLRKYYTSVIECQMKWDQHTKTDARNSDEQKMTDSLGVLIYSKFDVLNEFLILQDVFRVREALDKVIYDIEKSVHKREATADVKTGTPKKKRKFLSRLFKGKSENNNAGEIDSTISQEKITLYKVGRHVEKVMQEEEAIADSLRKKELALINSDKAITDQIRGVVSRLEYLEDMFIRKQRLKAQEAIKKTNFQIALFCLAVGILLMIVTHTIIRYISFSNKYRKALRKAKNETEEMAMAKDKFFTNISHEIRTPMNTISGFAELIGEGPLTNSQRDQLNMLKKSADHLLYLINDVLDIAKLDAGKLRLEAVGFHCCDVMTEIKNLMMPLALENETELYLNFKKNTTDEDIFIGDPYRLKQILLNIVGNAIKFTKKGKVAIFTETEEQDDKIILKIEVTDTGIGMSKRQLDKVFHEFEQADVSISRSYGGSGLGLSIVYKLVKLHGGEIKLNSKQGIGTSVFITLYYKKGNKDNLQNKIGELEPSIGLPQHLKVLVADDEIYNRKLLIAILKKYNAICVEAENGLAAIKELKRNDFDVILMDSRMPRMSGVDATIRIRKMQSAKKDIPIIALTAAVTDLDQKQYKVAGMQAFVAKPFKERELIETISGVIANGGYEPMVAAQNMQAPEIEAEHFDLTELRNLSRENDEFYKEMLGMFIESTSTGLKNIRINMEELNWQKVADHAHKISSPCRHVGANILYRQVKEIENICRNGNGNENGKETVHELFKNACSEFELIESEFKKELSK
jgi:signal transduction histidine kinase/DNA-binding NarL/FixJ family response regulator